MARSAASAGRAPVRPEIAMSWHRARLSGVGPESGARVTVVDVDRSSRLAIAAAPVLDDLVARLDDQSLCLMLADRDCRVIFQSGDRRLRAVLESGGVVVGSGLGEDAVGTNALGTAYELGHGVSINGAEHYLHAFKSFSCYGCPVRHPLTRRVEGILDITSTSRTANPLFGPLVVRAAQDIELRLLDGAREVERRLFLAFQHATRQRSSPIAVLGEDTVLTNRSCLERLGSADPSVLNSLALEARSLGDLTSEVDLGAMGTVAARAERIDGTSDGVLVHLGPRRPSVASTAPAATPALPTGRDLLVAGEPGTGRSTEAARLAGGGSTAHLDAAEALSGSNRAWAATLLGITRGDTDTVIVDDVDVLDAALCTVLGRAMGTAEGPRFVLTSGPTSELPSHIGRLVARCSDRVELSPLRDRRHDLNALFKEMARRAGNGRELILTPGALQALGAQPWPGNLVELANLVRELAELPTRRIEVGDLPERYRSTARRSGRGARERAERVAILHALKAHGGNKLRAARELGISRTTLYRRMKALDVPDDV
ncbi:sigma-54-dependent Fis family transcriptional regulator [Pseudonocardia endophytica]|uniref:Transcriptional regulator of acetoin/glycerol metabolism n=1 Tax=Pseudonocardia endophytica TaxID=401976 RepID=A0A4R1I0Y7_PSEEN|nr:helix-turn-helix domain-containing protein [Pseudonocardia endophytica]TCK27571.1 transcriptional regulator of acetoin/glycerol metabolism [Pseudonocardia endophytica]